MRADKLRHLIQIQTLDAANELDGDTENAWSNERQEWAYIRPLMGRELEQSQQMQSHTTHKITTRWFTGFDSERRFTYGSRIFHVESAVNIEERDRFIEWQCVEGGIV